MLVVLLVSGQVGEIQFFVCDRQTGITLAVFREIQPDLEKPIFFSKAGHHMLKGNCGVKSAYFGVRGLWCTFQFLIKYLACGLLERRYCT